MSVVVITTAEIKQPENVQALLNVALAILVRDGGGSLKLPMMAPDKVPDGGLLASFTKDGGVEIAWIDARFIATAPAHG